MLVPGPEQTDECQHPPVPPSCGDQHTITPPLQHCLQPHPPSTPRPLQSFARLHSKLRVTQHEVTELLDKDRRSSRDRQDGQLPVLEGKEGTIASSEHKSASSLVSRAPGLLPALQPPQDASAPREPGRTQGPRLLQPLQPPRDASAPRKPGRTGGPRLLPPLRPQREASAPPEPEKTGGPRLLPPLRPQREASAPPEPEKTGGPRLKPPRTRH
nr:actin cytoskeleton-regulatory complex protein pan1-like isoform X1 [Columba livia]